MDKYTATEQAYKNGYEKGYEAGKRDAVKCKIRIIKEIEGLFPECRPKVGKVYNAEYKESTWKQRKIPPICVINISGKRIIIRNGEYEIVGCEHGKRKLAE